MKLKDLIRKAKFTGQLFDNLNKRIEEINDKLD